MRASRNIFRCALFCASLLLQQAFVFAQERTISGIVKNNNGEALQSANVTLVDDQTTVVRYTATNGQGAYSLTIPKSPVPYWVEVSYIGYKKQRQPVEAGKLIYQFVLSADTGMLSEIIIKNRPVIELSGDTLRYYVMSFANKADRSIRDVLRRMPGIDVDADGTIYHNGKKVENLYIQGDDLMDGRYGLATKVIRKEMILSVDVIRNHQPIEVLKDKIVVDKTSINLVLKSENSLKLSANAMIGVGLPKQYDVSFTPILLNKRIKMLNTVATNNRGIDYRSDFKQLGATNMISSITNEKPEISLSLATIGPPDLPLSNYYFNRSAVLNLNNIYNTKSGVQFKANIQAYIDKNNLNYFSRVENYLANDTISYREQQSFTNKPALLNTSFNVMINRKSYFLNNNTRVKLSRDNNQSFMDFNDRSFRQFVHKNASEFSNDLNWIPSLRGKGVGELRWLINHARNNQVLDVGGGYYSEIKDHEGFYDHVVQRLEVPVLFSDAYLAYRIPSTIINQEYKMGFLSESQKLESSLDFIKNQQPAPYSGDAGNDLKWHRKNLYFSSQYEIKYKKIRSTIHLPLTYQNIHYYQTEYNVNSRSKRLLFNPGLSFTYNIKPEQYISARYKFNNTFGNITGLYRGVILHNYRTLRANDAGLQERTIHSSSIYYNFQKSISMFFMNAGASYDKIIAEAILSTDIANNVQKIVFLPYRNKQSNFMLSSGVSKYSFTLKTTFSLRSQWSNLEYVQLINNELMPFRSNTFSLNGSILKKVMENINITYQSNALWSNTEALQSAARGNKLAHRAVRLDQHSTVSFNIRNRLHFEIINRHSYSKQSNNNDVQYHFMDAQLRYTDSKKRLDLNLFISNLFNVRNYTLYSISANQLVTDQYNLRGRMAILRLDLYF
jgi:hypothetical protein